MERNIRKMERNKKKQEKLIHIDGKKQEKMGRNGNKGYENCRSPGKVLRKA